MTEPRVGHCVDVVVVRMCLVAVFVGVTACRNPTPGAPGDASVTPLSPDEASALAEAFLDAREARGTESCRCAGDVPFCEAETIPSVDAASRTCLDGAIATGGASFRGAIPCLAAAAATYVGCAAPYACADVAPRTACREGYEAAGTACFVDDPALGGLLAACLPEAD